MKNCVNRLLQSGSINSATSLKQMDIPPPPDSNPNPSVPGANANQSNSSSQVPGTPALQQEPFLPEIVDIPPPPPDESENTAIPENSSIPPSVSASNTKNAPSSSNTTQDSETFTLPVVSIAQNVAQLAKPHLQVDDSGNPQLYPLKFPFSVFRYFGKGIEIYFQFLALLIFFFCCIAFIGILQTIVLSSNNVSSGFGLITIANINYSGTEIDPVLLWYGLLDIVNCFLLIGLVASLRAVMRYNREREIESGESTFDDCDYSIWVRRIPKALNDPVIIKDFFSQFGKVVTVVMIYDFGKIPMLFVENQRIQDNLKYISWSRKHKSSIPIFKRLLRSVGTFLLMPFLIIGRKMNLIDKTYAQLLEADSQNKSEMERLLLVQKPHAVGAFVTFDTRSERNRCLRVYRSQHDELFTDDVSDKRIPCITKCGVWGCPSFVKCCLRSKYKIQKSVPLISEAPSASDFVWLSAPVSTFVRVWRNFVSTGIMLVAVSFSFLVLIGFLILRNNLKDAFLSAIIGLLVSLTNASLEFLSQKLAPFEVHATKTDSSRSRMVKVWLFSSLNSCVAVLVVNMLTCNCTVAENSFAVNFALDGLSVIVSETILGNLIRTSLPFFYLKRFVSTASTQQKLNQLWTPPQFRISETFGICFKMLTLAFVFGFFSPILYLFVLVYFASLFYVDRYRLLRLLKSPLKYSESIYEPIYRLCIVVIGFKLLISAIFIRSAPFSGLYFILMFLFGSLIIFPSFSMMYCFITGKILTKLSVKSYLEHRFGYDLVDDLFKKKTKKRSSIGSSYFDEPDVESIGELNPTDLSKTQEEEDQKKRSHSSQILTARKVTFSTEYSSFCQKTPHLTHPFFPPELPLKIMQLNPKNLYWSCAKYPPAFVSKIRKQATDSLFSKV